MGLDQSARETKRRRNSEQIKQKPDELPGLTGAMLRARTRKKAAEVTQLWRHARRPTKYGERAVKAHGSGKWVDLTSAELQLEWKPFNLRLVYVCKMKQQQLHSSVTLKTNSFTLFDSCCCCLWARMQVQRSTAAQKHPDNKPAESGQSFTASSHTRPHFHHTHTHTQGKTSSRWVREPITGSMGPIFSAFVVWSLAHCADMQASEWFIFTWGTEAGRARRCCHFSTTKDAQH